MKHFERRAVLFILLSLCAASLNADQITLKNGDRITGAIVKKDGGTLTVKSDVMGVVTIPWAQVVAVKSDEALNVVVADHTVKATLDSSNGQIALSGTQPPTLVAPAAIVAIRNNAEQEKYERLLHPGWLQLWGGTATLGLSGTLGNAETSTFTTDVKAARNTNHDQTSVYFNAVKASAKANGLDSETAQAIRGGWKYDRKVGSRLEVNTFNDYEYDRFQSLDLRFVLGGGLGYRTWKSSRGSLALQGGLDYDRDKFSSTAESVNFSRNSADGYWGDDFSYKLGMSNIVQTFRMFNTVSDDNAYRINFDLTANTKLRKWLIWNISASDHYLSNPVPGFKTNDVLYTTGIGVNFGH